MVQDEENGLTKANLPDADWQIVADESDAGLADEAQTFDGLIDAIESTMERARNAAARHVCIDQLLACLLYTSTRGSPRRGSPHLPP